MPSALAQADIFLMTEEEFDVSQTFNKAEMYGIDPLPADSDEAREMAAAAAAQKRN
jgi:hypothetical protein